MIANLVSKSPDLSYLGKVVTCQLPKKKGVRLLGTGMSRLSKKAGRCAVLVASSSS